MNQLGCEVHDGVDFLTGLELGGAAAPVLHAEGDDALLHHLFEEVVVMLADYGIAVHIVICFVNFDPGVHVLFKKD
jgi:hypothetical protein